MDISRLCSNVPSDVQVLPRPSSPSSPSSPKPGNALTSRKPPYALPPITDPLNNSSDVNRTLSYPPSPSSVDSITNTPPHQPQYTLPPMPDFFRKTNSTYNIPHYVSPNSDTSASIVNMLPNVNARKLSSFDFGNMFSSNFTPTPSISLPPPPSTTRVTLSNNHQPQTMQTNASTSQQSQSSSTNASASTTIACNEEQQQQQQQEVVQIIDIINLCTGLCNDLDKCRDRNTPSNLKATLLESASRTSKDILSNLFILEAYNREQQKSRKRSATCLDPDDADGEKETQKEDEDPDYAAIRQARMFQDFRPKYRRRTKRSTEGQRCHSCNTTETPEWRRGPDGARTLCNACGLHYSKLLRKGSLLVQTQQKLLTQGSAPDSTSARPSSQRIVHFPIIQVQGQYGEKKDSTTASITATTSINNNHASQFRHKTELIDSTRIKEID